MQTTVDSIYSMLPLVLHHTESTAEIVKISIFRKAKHHRKTQGGIFKNAEKGENVDALDKLCNTFFHFLVKI